MCQNATAIRNPRPGNPENPEQAGVLPSAASSKEAGWREVTAGEVGARAGETATGRAKAK